MIGRGLAQYPPGRDDDGLALVLALLFIVLLTALVVDFSYEMEVEASFVQAQNTEFTAYLAAKSAIAGGLGMLAADIIVEEEQDAANAKGTSGKNSGSGPADQSISRAVDCLEDAWAMGVPMAPMNDSLMQCTIDDEYGKINLNALVYLRPDASPEDEDAELVNGKLRDMLLFLFDFRELEEVTSEEIVDCILDWLDKDAEERDSGAETDYYQGLDPPFASKDGPMDHISELLLIPGITPKVYFGDPEMEQVPLNELLTVHGHPQGKINVNTAEPEVLQAYFAADGNFPDPVAMALQVIQNLEQNGPYEGLQDMESDGLIVAPRKGDDGKKPGKKPKAAVPAGGAGDGTGDEDAQDEIILLEWASETFRLYGDGEAGDSKVRIEAYVWRDTHAIGTAQMFRILDWRVIR